MPPVVAKRLPIDDDVLFVQLAREIAMDVSDLESILDRYHVTDKQWDTIQRNPRFDALLKSAIVEWQSAINTEQRIKVKSAVLIEEWLSEANSRIHDRTESLAAKVELAKFLSRLASLGLTGAHAEGGGEKFSLTINLGADSSIKIEKTVTPKVIDITPTQTQE